MEQLATQIKGLSDPTRLRILNLLKGGELCVCDLIATLDMPQSTISRHLSSLRKTGWIEMRRQGKWAFYRRPVHPAPFIGYALAMLDDEFANQKQARMDDSVLTLRMLEKTSGRINSEQEEASCNA